MTAGVLIVTTTSCPNCPDFKREMRKLEGVSIQFIDENEPTFSAICKEHELTTAPMAIVFDENNTVVYKGNDIEDIKSNL